MAFDPAADPWGTAMLGAAAIVVLAVFILVAAIVTSTPKRASGRVLALGSLLFLGAAVGGTWERVVVADAQAREAAKPKVETVTIVAPTPPPDPDGEQIPPAAAPEPGHTAKPATGDPLPAAPAQPETAPTAVAAIPEPPTVAAVPDTTPPVAGLAPDLDLAPSQPAKIETDAVTLTEPTALPSEPTEKKKAVAAALRAARAVATHQSQCASAKEVGEAWLTLKPLPSDTRGLAGAVAKLEACRKRIRSAKAYWVRRQRITARNAYAEELPAKLRQDESYVFVSVRGPAHERMRIGGKSITPQRVKGLLNVGLEAELKALGFSEVTFASGKNTTTKKYDGLSDAAVTDQVMARWGLGARLSLD